MPERITTRAPAAFLHGLEMTWMLKQKAVNKIMKTPMMVNIETLLTAAKEAGIAVFISPHYYY